MSSAENGPVGHIDGCLAMMCSNDKNQNLRSGGLAENGEQGDRSTQIHIGSNEQTAGGCDLRALARRSGADGERR